MKKILKKNKNILIVITSIVLAFVILLTSLFYMYIKLNISEKRAEAARQEAIEQYFSFDWYEKLSDEMYDYIMYLGERGYHCNSVMDDENSERNYTYDIECIDELGNSSARDYAPVVVNGVDYSIDYSISITGIAADKYYISPLLSVTMVVNNSSDEYDVLKKYDEEINIVYAHHNTGFNDTTRVLIEKNYIIIYDQVCSTSSPDGDYVHDIMRGNRTVDLDSDFMHDLVEENKLTKEQSVQLCNQLIAEGYSEQMYDDVIKDLEADFDEIIAEGERVLN